MVIFEDKGAHSVVSSSTGNLTVTVNSCQCTFWKTMHLSCRHMFAVRENKQVHVRLCANTSEVVSERWKMVYMQDKYYNKRSSTTSVDDSF